MRRAQTLRRGILAALAALTWAAPRPARATSNDWSLTVPATVTIGGVSVAAAITPTYNIPVDDGAGTTTSVTYFAAGNTLAAKRNETGSTGSPPQDWGKAYAVSSTISKFPVVVPVSGDGGAYRTFFTATNGFLYKLDDKLNVLSSRDMGRHLGCLDEDTLTAPPTVLLKSAYPSLPDDLIVVATNHGCSDRSLNQLIAIPASGDIGTNTPTWTFNEYGEYQVDYFSEGCAIDYGRGRLYCGTNLESGRAQNTFWGIDFTTGQAVFWSNANSIRNRPALGRVRASDGVEHIYVADQQGILHAFDPDSSGPATEDWQVPVTAVVSAISTNIWAEFRPPYNNLVLVTDAAGTIHAVYDGWSKDYPDPSAGSIAWEYTPGAGVKVTSLGSVAPTLGKLYVGTSDGKIRQLQLATGAEETSVTVNAANNVVTDPTLLLTSGASDVNKLVVSSYGSGAAGVVKQYPVPFPTAGGTDIVACDPKKNPADPNLGNPDCEQSKDGFVYHAPSTCAARQLWDTSDPNYGKGDPTNDCCSIGRCDEQGVCYAAPRDAGKTNGCNDGTGGCGTGAACRFGQCRSTTYNTDPKSGCVTADKCAVDKRACGPGRQCALDSRSQSWTCVDLSGADGGPCGSLSRVCADDYADKTVTTWGGNRTCVAGRCVRDSGACGGGLPAVPDFAQEVLSYASGLAFERGADACSAWLSHYQAQPDTDLGSGTTTVQFTPNRVCAVCGYANTRQLMAGQSVSLTFTDPTPGQSVTGYAQPVAMRVRVRGNVNRSLLICQTGAVTADINGTTIGTVSVTAPCPAGNACGSGACGDLADQTLSFGSGFPGTWNPNAANTLTLYAAGGDFNLAEAIIDVTSNDGRSYVTRLSMVNGKPSAGVYRAEPQQGYMHGIAVTPTPGRTGYEVYTSFIDRPREVDPDKFTVADGAQSLDWVGMGRLTDNVMLGYDSSGWAGLTLTPPPRPTWCTDPTGCPFATPSFNYGPTAPATDFTAITSGGAVYAGNYQMNGDVYKITYNPFTGQLDASSYWPNEYYGAILPAPGCARNLDRCQADADCKNKEDICVASVCTAACKAEGDCAAAGYTTCMGGYCTNAKSCVKDQDCPLATPSCVQGYCAACDRVSAVDIGPGENSRKDDLLKVAVGTRIFYIANTLARGLDIKYVLDLRSPRQPTYVASGVSYGGSGLWALRGLLYAKAITSIAVDPLNRSNDLYVAVREVRGGSSSCPGTYMDILQVRGDDFTVRPLGGYRSELKGCAIVNGALQDVGGTVIPSQFPAGSDFGGDLRVTATSLERLHVLAPVDPLAKDPDNQAKLTWFDLAP